MSMNCGFRQISPSGLAVLVVNPKLAPAAIDFGLPEVPGLPGVPLGAELSELLQSVPAAKRDEMQRRLAESLQEFGAADLRDTEASGSLERLGLSPNDLDSPITVDKAWHGLHYLLSGTAWEPSADPASHAILGGEPLGEDLGYGPLRYLGPSQVSAAAQSLRDLTTASLEARYSASEMEQLEIYPGGWHDPENMHWLVEAFRKVDSYYAAAGQRGWGMLLCLT